MAMFHSPPWLPLFLWEAGTHPPGAHTPPDPPSCCPGGLEVLLPPPEVLLFLGCGGWSPPGPLSIVPAATAAARLNLPDGASSTPPPSAFLVGLGSHPLGHILIAPVAIGVTWPFPSHPPRPLSFVIGVVATPVRNMHGRSCFCSLAQRHLTANKCAG